MKNCFLVTNYYSSHSGNGYCVSLFTEDPLTESEICHILSICPQIRPPDVNFFVTKSEVEKELQFFGIPAANYESSFYTSSIIPAHSLFPSFQISPLINSARVLCEKYRKGLYRRTCLLNENIIMKEFSGGPIAKSLFANGESFLKNGPYRDYFVESHRDDESSYYFYKHKKFLGDMTLYDLVFSKRFDLEEIYARYMQLVGELWPFVHLDLHGDNILITGQTPNQQWFAIDFESIVQLPIEKAYHLYNGLFIQMVGHAVSKDTLNSFSLMAPQGFYSFIENRQ